MNRDYLELLQCLREYKVRYLIIGGYAVIRHSEPRYTKDLELWVDATKSNAARVINALKLFGAPIDNLSVEDLAKPGLLYVFGVPPLMGDILNKVKGGTFERALKKREKVDLLGTVALFVDKTTLVALKRRAGRPQDLADLEKLVESTSKSKKRKPLAHKRSEQK
jgi:hypothetical protein